MSRRWSFWIAGLMLLAGGCAAPTQPNAFEIGPGAYAETFDAVRDELRRAGFELERVDARAGVITTQSRASAGLATPWIGDESSFADEWTALTHHQRRKVRVTFEPIESGGVEHTATGAFPEGGGESDLRLLGGSLRVSVVVQVEEYRRLGVQVDPVSVRLSSVYEDVTNPDQPMPKRYVYAEAPDEDLAGRLAQAMSKRLESTK